MRLQEGIWGKGGIRLSKVIRTDDRHDIIDMTVWIRLAGGTDDAFTEGDNSRVLPTDTMKNTVYVLAHEHEFGSIEDFGLLLCHHFLDRLDSVGEAQVSLERRMWRRMTVDGELHPHAFVQRTAERHTCTVVDDRTGPVVVAGVEGLGLLKTTGSAFTGFPRDEYTTLPEATDRVMSTFVEADWRYEGGPDDYLEAWYGIRRTLTESFASHDESQSVQHTLYSMAGAVIDGFAEVAEITMRLPNAHHLTVDLSPFGITNRDVVMQPVDEPYGMIEARVSRD
ncbi:MAG TPA: urate oxidase [Acidimicrobiia bacterium]